MSCSPSEESTIFVDRGQAGIVLEENLGLQGKIRNRGKASIDSDLELNEPGQDQ